MHLPTAVRLALYPTCSDCSSWLGPRVDQDGRTVGNCASVLTRGELLGKGGGPYVFGEGAGHTHEQGLKWARLAVPADFGCRRWTPRSP